MLGPAAAPFPAPSRRVAAAACGGRRLRGRAGARHRPPPLAPARLARSEIIIIHLGQAGVQVGNACW